MLRNSWRLLTINNSLSERMGWVVVASVVVSEYDALGWDTVTSRRELVPIATLGERGRRRRRRAARARLCCAPRAERARPPPARPLGPARAGKDDREHSNTIVGLSLLLLVMLAAQKLADFVWERRLQW